MDQLEEEAHKDAQECLQSVLKLKDLEEASSLTDMLFSNFYAKDKGEKTRTNKKLEIDWDLAYTQARNEWHGQHAVGVPHEKLFPQGKLFVPYKSKAMNEKEVSVPISLSLKS